MVSSETRGLKGVNIPLTQLESNCVTKIHL